MAMVGTVSLHHKPFLAPQINGLDLVLPLLLKGKLDIFLFLKLGPFYILMSNTGRELWSRLNILLSIAKISQS